MRTLMAMLTMKKKKHGNATKVEDDEHDLEILKAVAQAWHSRSGTSRATNEFDAHQKSYKTKPPTRFRLEAFNNKPSANGANLGSSKWDFNKSLWDSYEIVSVSRRLEAGMVLDDPFKDLSHDQKSRRIHRRRSTESKNSLRNLFNLMSSRRFIEPDDDDEDQH